MPNFVAIDPQNPEKHNFLFSVRIMSTPVPSSTSGQIAHAFFFQWTTDFPGILQKWNPWLGWHQEANFHCFKDDNQIDQHLYLIIGEELSKLAMVKQCFLNFMVGKGKKTEILGWQADFFLTTIQSFNNSKTPVECISKDRSNFAIKQGCL